LDPAPALSPIVKAVSDACCVDIGSVAVRVDSVLYVSGTLGLDKDTMKLVPGGTEAETRKTFDNLKAVLESSGSNLDKVVSVKVYLDDIKDGPVVNQIYQEYLKPPFPARCMMEVSKLPLGAKIEVEATVPWG